MDLGFAIAVAFRVPRTKLSSFIICTYGRKVATVHFGITHITTIHLSFSHLLLASAQLPCRLPIACSSLLLPRTVCVVNLTCGSGVTEHGSFLLGGPLRPSAPPFAYDLLAFSFVGILAPQEIVLFSAIRSPFEVQIGSLLFHSHFISLCTTEVPHIGFSLQWIVALR